MGTNFLAAGFLQEQLAELHEKAEQLKHLLEMNEHDRDLLVDRYAAQGYYTTYVREVEKALNTVVSASSDMHDFLSRLSCQPIIYTGEGETQQVVDMLERLLILYQSDAPAGDKRRVVGS
ncbi:MAG: hypothetical protein ACYC5Y_13000 [Symbiobacteriia bacterium]